MVRFFVFKGVVLNFWLERKFCFELGNEVKFVLNQERKDARMVRIRYSVV